MEKIQFGPDKKMGFSEPLDTWLTAGLRDFAVPEAVGSSARVFTLHYTPFSGEFSNHPVIKVMRPDKIQYALPLFINEVNILSRMNDMLGITPMLGLGFIQIAEGQLPDELAPLTTSQAAAASASALTGTADLYTLDEMGAFLSEIESRATEGWLAFIILPRRWEDNLYLRCDAGYTRGEYIRTFSVESALRAGQQISRIIQTAHENQIVYLDHKILHYYWNDVRQQVYVLDWNIGRQITNGNSEDIYHFDILQFSARALHHLLTGRQAPGSVRVGPNKPEEIENAPEKYEPVWTYDDQKRLTQDELDVLGDAIQGKYATAEHLAQDLQSLYNQRQSQG